MKSEQMFTSTSYCEHMYDFLSNDKSFSKNSEYREILDVDKEEGVKLLRKKKIDRFDELIESIKKLKEDFNNEMKRFASVVSDSWVNKMNKSFNEIIEMKPLD